MKPTLKLLFLALIYAFSISSIFSQNTRETAIVLTNPGSFVVSYENKELWYKFTADSACTITFSTDIKSSENIQPFFLYMYKDTNDFESWFNSDVNCCISNEFLKTTKKSEISTLIKPGEEIYFKILQQNELRDFDFTISLFVGENIPGTSFQNPLPVSLDSIPMIVSNTDKNHSFVYYGFTAQEDMILNLSLGVYYMAYEMLEDGTGIPTWLGDQVIYKGTSYLFQFPATTTKDLFWYLTADSVKETGKDCETQRRITSPGSYQIDNSDGSDWIQFVAQNSGHYTFSIDSTMNSDVQLIKWSSCPSDLEFSKHDTIYSKKIERYFVKGDRISFELTGGSLNETYYFNIQYEKEKQGDKCENPLIVETDSFYSQKTPTGFYQFTPIESGQYLISFNNYAGEINITIGCNTLKEVPIKNHNSSSYIIDAQKDSSYIVEIFNYWYKEYNTFYISKIVPVDGDSCSKAIEIPDSGSHLFDRTTSELWLTSYIQKSGMLKISTKNGSNSFDYFSIKKGNCGSLSYIGEDFELESSNIFTAKCSVTKGDTIFICIISTQSISDPYNVTLEYIEIVTEENNCLNPIQSIHYPDNYTTSYTIDEIVKFYSFTLDHETEITISDGSSSNILQIYSDCQTRFALSEAGEMTKMFAAGDYIVEWINTSGEDINWSISLNDNPDTDKDGKLNAVDEDDDNDGVLDTNDALPYDPLETTDNDNDQIGDNTDTDDDNDGILDIYDPYPLGNVSVTEIDRQAGVKVVPNPAQDILTLFGLQINSVVALQIIDAKGDVVYRDDNYNFGTPLDIRFLSKGLYYVKVNDKPNEYIINFIKN